MSAGVSIAMMMTVLASNASISRKSLFSKPGTVIQVQFFPPSSDLPMVPLLPLTQTILSLTALRPRKDTGSPAVRILMEGPAGCRAEVSDVVGASTRKRFTCARVLSDTVAKKQHRD